MALDLLPFPVPQYGGAQADVFSKSLNGALGTIGLDKVYGNAEKHHDDDDAGVNSLA